MLTLALPLLQCPEPFGNHRAVAPVFVEAGRRIEFNRFRLTSGGGTIRSAGASAFGSGVGHTGGGAAQPRQRSVAALTLDLRKAFLKCMAGHLVEFGVGERLGGARAFDVEGFGELDGALPLGLEELREVVVVPDEETERRDSGETQPHLERHDAHTGQSAGPSGLHTGSMLFGGSLMSAMPGTTSSMIGVFG